MIFCIFFYKSELYLPIYATIAFKRTGFSESLSGTFHFLRKLSGRSALIGVADTTDVNFVVGTSVGDFGTGKYDTPCVICIFRYK